MIQAFIFDLDGTLVDTEPLKNLAYARVALELSPDGLRAEEVIAVATQLIGVPAPETAMEMVRRLGLEERARARMSELGATTPWQAFSRLHTLAYNQLLDEPGVLQRTQLPHAVSLLYQVRRTGFKTGLATMSYRREVQRVLNMLDWASVFDAVATADDVTRGKPDPEVYLRVAQTLALRPGECVVIEDSPSGIAGALAAGMCCIAVPTGLTRAAVHRTRLDERWIVDDPGRLRTVVERMLAERVEGRE
jgi:HAD superfamily hydrolase (TIGR01509 family)